MNNFIKKTSSNETMAIKKPNQHFKQTRQAIFFINYCIQWSMQD